MNDNLLTAGSIAQKLGVSKKEVNNAIKTIGLKPERKKGSCEYFPSFCLEAIQKTINVH
jgi:predicted RNA binding protein YcfA (HicA-like mRNA interferase family)